MAKLRPGRPRPALNTWNIALILVFLAALSLRLYGLTWDDGADLHPDELFVAKIVLIDRIHLDWPPDVAQLLDPARSGLNPRSADPVTGQYREFAYGALPLWATDFTAWLLSKATGVNWNAAERAFLVGRIISALLSASTVLIVAALGVRLGGRRLGLLAALFAALAPMSIQLAHFFTTDSWLTFFVSLCLLACCRAADRATARSFLLAGCAYGLAMATKGSVVALGAPILVALLLCAQRDPDPRWWRRLLLRAPHAVAAAIGAAAAFIAFEPYALLRPGVYIQSLRTQADIVSGAFDVPFTRVFSGTTTGVYHAEQLVRWGVGPVAGVLALGGVCWLISRAWQRIPAALVLVSWFFAYSAVISTAEVKFLRYLEPLAPVLAICAAGALLWCIDAVQRRGSPALATALAAGALLLSFGWTAAFMSIYAHENPRVAATNWIYAEVPPGSRLTAEYWDDALPRSLGYGTNPAAAGLGVINFDLYRDLPPPEAANAIAGVLERTDYVVQSSQRVEAGVRAEPWRYPVQIAYYDALARGELGFRRAATFASQPGIGPLRIDDRLADESFINYDHPFVTIWAKDRPFDRAAFDAAMSWAEGRPWQPARWQTTPSLLLDTPVGDNPAVNDARWSEVITGNTLGAVIVWVGLLMGLLAAGLPWARLLFGAFPDAGWGLARGLALVLAAYPLWLAASVRLLPFRAIWAIVALILVAATGWWLARRSVPAAPALSRAWRGPELAFWLVFAIFLAFRFAVPDGWHPFWGGEKPMEFALINAIERSAYFPPFDPWFADGYVNYYYYGFYLIAFLFKLIGIPSEIGFNLALPTMMGLIASGGFTVAGAITRAMTASPRYARLAGWAAVAALCLIGNLSALHTLLVGTGRNFDPFITWTWNGSRAIDFAITEFPYFTGLYADLHAHLIAMPITLTIIAVCLALTLDNAGDGPDTPLRRPLLLGMAALLLGTLFVTNAWDVPVYAALTLVSALSCLVGWQRGWRSAAIRGAQAVAALVGAWLLFLPFHRHFVALFSQVALVRDPTDLLQFLTHFGGLLTVSALGLTAVLLPRRSAAEWPLWPVVAVGVLLAGVIVSGRSEGRPASLLASLLVLAGLAGPPAVAAIGRGLSERGSGWLPRLAVLTALLGALAGLGALAAGRAVLGIALALLGAAVAGWLITGAPGERFVCLLLAAAYGVAGGVEVVVVADDLIGSDWYRMNTVFKFYNQIWILLAVACAALIAVMAERWLGDVAEREQAPANLVWSRAGVVAATLLAVASLSYPALATMPRLEQRLNPGAPPGSLNALDWMTTGSVPVIGSPEFSQIRYAGDRAAIDWLQHNVSGSPVIAEASIGPYRCNGSRISIATGLPTIIGWERHQQQQRPADVLPQRVADVRTLYTSPDVAEKAAILRKYRVQYVIVGDLERVYPTPNNECTPGGSAAGIAALESMVGTTLDEVFSQDGTTIYRVRPLGAAS